MTSTVRGVFLPAFLLISAMSVLWALASPVFSVPDENAHATKAIAQVRGQIIGDEVEGVRHLVVSLPEGYRYDPAILCFAQYPAVTADCAVGLGSGTGQDWFNTWVGAYNPVYYWMVGWPSLILDGSAGIYGMRIVSAIINAALLALAFQTALAGRRVRWMPLGLAFLLGPMVVYFAGSVNPQGLEVAAAAALWCGLLRLVESHGDPEASTLPKWHLWVVVTVAAALLANARATGPLWVVIIVLLCLLVGGWGPTRSIFTTAMNYWWMGAIAVAGISSFVWTLRGGSLSNQAEESDAPLVHAGFLEGFTYMIRQVPGFVQQSVAYFGWLDTPMPDSAYLLFFIPIAVLVLLAFTTIRSRDGVVLLTVMVAALLVPALVQGFSVGQTGIIWQGRYGLFLYIGIALVAGWLLSGDHAGRVAFLSVRMTAILTIMLASFGAFAFVVALSRYVVGIDRPLTDMLRAAAWQPPLGWLVLTVLFSVVIALAAAWIIRLAVTMSRSEMAVLTRVTP